MKYYRPLDATSLEEMKRQIKYNIWLDMEEEPLAEEIHLQLCEMHNFPIRKKLLSQTVTGDLMTMKEFVSACKDGLFINDDGDGEYSDGKYVTNCKIKPSDIHRNVHNTDWSHVMWYNK